MPGTNLIVPVVLWGKHAPTHCISSVYLSRDQRTLVTGCYDGQICIWQVEPESLRMTPRCLLVGHTAPVTCLSRASIIQDNNYIVSSSEAGEMCTWDLVDGKCRESVKLSQIHTNIQAYHMCNSEDLRLFCNGYYAEILIMDPFSLEILFSLSSKVNPDWISALHVLRPSSRKDDVVLAISITGTVKVWSLLGHENKQSEPIYENESKQIRCLNALSLNCCAYNQRTVLIVCAKYCQIYDAGDFSVLCSIQAPQGERWMSGDFLAPDRVLVWSTEGKGCLFRLPSNSVPDHKGFHGPTVDHDSPVLFGILAHPDNKLLSCPPSMRFIVTSCGGKQRRLLLRGDSAGVVSLWNVDDAATPVQNQMPSHAPIVMTSLDMAWAEMNPSPVGILDQLSQPEESEIKLTASIYLLAANRLVVGREDGSIVIVNATHTVQLQLLHGTHQQLDDWPPHQLLLGHNGRVNCLLYPHHVHPRYDKAHLVSGGIDFAVCLWDLFSGVLLHRFCVHAGEITQLIVPPHNCSPRIQKCICSVASDHSVTLLSLAERKCVTLASRHLFPVVSIKWRPADDFMAVGCSDGTVYVWQMETAHLDRVLHGMIAEEVLAACDETVADDLGGSVSSDSQGLANPAVHFFRGLRHRNVAAMRAATQRGLAALQHQGGGGSLGPLAEPSRARRAPLTVQGFRSNPADPESHILFFDIEGLIVELLSEEYSCMSPASLEAAGLITSEYMKVAALTQSASPDATKRISGILAKMKEGAETMQTKLQAKAEQLKGHLDPKGKIFTHAVSLGAEGPYGLETIFDFVIFGPVSDTISDSDCNNKNSMITLVEAVERFWRSEEPPNITIKDPADIECENLFTSTTTRGADGKYTVRLPLIPNHKRLGESRQVALQRFLSIERRMKRQPEFRDKYVKFMTEYIELGHMTLSNRNLESEGEHYFLAHHGVFKKSGEINKIRVVFDGSVKSLQDGKNAVGGHSLNDCLYSGERLQNDITMIILNFRWPRIVFTTDVRMMFRQTWIHPDDRKYHLIFWRSSPSEPLLVYELTTNTYGLKSSPFISIRCLHQLAYDEQHKYPRAAQLLLKNSYVDDLSGGADTLTEARELKDELLELMKTAGYELRKWSSNNPALLDRLPSEYLEFPRSFDEYTKDTGYIKVLGIQWDPKSDSFSYRLNLPPERAVTRRNILSLVTRLYDPLGWICPVVFKIKLLLQGLLSNDDTSRKIDWDAPVSINVVRQWLDIITDLPNLERISLPRCLKPINNAKYSLHGFCDGSSVGFASAVYVRVEQSDGEVFLRLLLAKSRVAPLKSKRTIPKLELSGAVLLTTLLNCVVSSMQHNIAFDEVVGWCDSTIVLAWLQTPPHKLQVFEGNRVAQINLSAIKIHWRYVPSEMNCVDVATRGSTAAELLQHPLWWGPQWLHVPSYNWPKDTSDIPTALPGLKASTANVGTTESEFNLVQRYSSFNKLVNITAYILRFRANSTSKNKLTGNLTVLERRNAVACLIRYVQGISFEEELKGLRSGKPIKNSLRRLNLFIDSNNVIRVGGRINEANLPYDARHPVLLPGKCNFTELLVTYYHQIYCHVGANTLASILSRSYWIISARQITRRITFRCIQCYRSKARATQPFMADLPPDRVKSVRAFMGTGTDFCGPFYIKTNTLRNAKIQKCYLCIFVCLASKAVHLEVVSDLSVEAFIATFTRFISRRGLPSLIRSDCGTNYTGSDKYIKELYIFIKNNFSDIERKLTMQNVTWLFNAPSFPNSGGLFEAAVKSAKTHARRVLGDTRLTFEGLTTFFTKVEAVLNSRPLCPLSTDPADLEVLTPGHFLIGQPLVALPEYPYTDVSFTRLSRYQQIQKLTQHFWSRWNNEYLHTLQQRYKWTSQAEPPKLDDLVLIKEDNTPSLHWKRGRLVKLLPGKDGILRVAEVKTQNGVLLRPVSKLCRLPMVN